MGGGVNEFKKKKKKNRAYLAALLHSFLDIRLRMGRQTVQESVAG